jgi:hypothetical protein
VANGCRMTCRFGMESWDEPTGELALDLANTLRRERDGGTTDLLADPDRLAGWLRRRGAPGDVGAPALRELRGRVRTLLAAAVRRRALPRLAVAAVNRAVAAAPTSPPRRSWWWAAPGGTGCGAAWRPAAAASSWRRGRGRPGAVQQPLQPTVGVVGGSLASPQDLDEQHPRVEHGDHQAQDHRGNQPVEPATGADQQRHPGDQQRQDRHLGHHHPAGADPG